MNEKRFFQDWQDGKPRGLRAHQFAKAVIDLMHDFTPQNMECLSASEDHLAVEARVRNLAIITVPPECDHLDKLGLERARSEKSVQFAGGDTVL
jgi:hypothetical protein